MKNGDYIMKELKLIAVLSLIMLTSIVMVACKKYDDKIPDPGGEFDYTRVLVYLTDEVSAIDKEWAPADFSGFAFSRIVDCRGVGGAEHLFFYLTESSRDNVLKAIYYLRSRPEIKSANVLELGVEFGD